jgi:hypothetical protein
MHTITFYFQESAHTAVLISTDDNTETHYYILFEDNAVKKQLGDRFKYVFSNNNLLTLTERSGTNQRLLDFFYDQIMLYRIQKHLQYTSPAERSAETAR